MAQITPRDILKLSEPIEKVYSDIVDALLINMAKHFNSGHALSTTEWESKKLAELGQLNKESIEIIAKLTKQMPAMIQIALEDVVIKATKDIEPELKKAVQNGVIQNAVSENVIASPSIVQALQAYERQAADTLNLVNTTMIQSTLSQYRRMISNTVMIERQIQAAQDILNTAAGKVIAGTESRQKALRQALMQIHKEGITGFYDRAGRKWSPEAYANMDIRTTVHNTGIEAVRIRQEDYGISIFRVSRHNGARPLCYPYQGKYYSWDNTSGAFIDGEGNTHRYEPISSTSYGEPAGLFGINCGHHPITVIPGVSIPRDRDVQTQEENDRDYQQSQEQRSLERDIKNAKRKAVMLDAAGDKEGFEQEARKIKDKQARYNAFCKATGRAKRLDRTQVYEYNKSVSRKAVAAARREQETVDLYQLFKSNRSYIQKDGTFDIELAKKDYADFIEQAPERIRDVLRYAFGSTPFIETSHKDIVFAYSPKREAILYDSNDERFQNVLFGIASTHELGHRIDDMFHFTQNNEGFTEAIRIAEKVLGKEQSKFIDYSWENDEDGFISDIFSAIDKSDFYSFGHKASYWKTSGLREAEIYANIFSLESIGDNEKLNYLREHFPEIMKEYDKLEFEV